MNIKSTIHTAVVLSSLILGSACFAADPIVGGTTVTGTNAISKHTVGLMFVLSTQNGKPAEYATCSGSILDNTRVLTAAHCVHGGFKQGYVIFSPNDLSSLFDKVVSSGVASVPQFHLITHAKEEPGYSGQQGGTAEFNDLAVVTFAGGLAPGYVPAQFLLKADAVANLSKNAPITLAGYGITSPQTAANANQPDGVGTLRSVKLTVEGFSAKGIDLLVQASTGHDACEGDSGGPAMITVGGETYVVGVLSRSDCRTVSIYTFVDHEIISAL